MHNRKAQDIDGALDLAITCVHPDARYLVSLFENVQRPITKETARDMFLAQPETDARALLFSELVSSTDHETYNRDRVIKSANLEYALAQAVMCSFMLSSYEHFKYAKSAADQGEYNGYNLMGNAYLTGIGCDKNKSKAKEYFLLAIKYGHIPAMNQLGLVYDSINPKRWIWWGRAAKAGFPFYFIQNFILVMSPKCVFQIGCHLDGHIDIEFKLFNQTVDSEVAISAKRAVEFYINQVTAYRAAVHTWTIIARRLGIIKDMRRMVGSMIWSAREEAEFKN